MAEYAGSIDDEVQRKVDAYRSNPGALKQRYQMNQDLLDLLALQRINKEMQEKKRDIEMSMQQNPQTIKQQREAEVLGMTKDDLGRQVGGIMAQRQAAQQQNLQRVASGQRPATRMPMNPQMAGIASQPAPNMARMAQGGVVTFAEGDSVKGESEEDRRKREATEILAEVGVTPERFAAASPEEKARIKEAINEKRGIQRVGLSMAQPFAFLYDAANVPFKVGADVVGAVGRATGLMDPTERFGFEERGFTPAMDALSRNAPPQIAMSQLSPAAPVSPAQAQAQAQAPAPAPAPVPQAPAIPNVQARGILDSELGKKLLQEQTDLGQYQRKQLQRDTAAERAAREAGVGALLRRNERAAMYDKYIADRDAMMKRQAAARKARGPLADYVSGSSAFGRLGQKAIAGEERRMAQEVADLDTLYRMAKQREEADIEAGKAQVTAGGITEQMSESAKRSASQGMQTRINSLFDVLGIEASNKTKADIANVEAALKSEANAISRMNFQSLDMGRRLNLLASVEEGIAKLSQKYDEGLAKEIEGLTLVKGLKDDALAAEEKRVTANWNKAKEQAVKDLQRLRSDLRRSVTGGAPDMEVVGSRPDSK